MKCLFGFPCAGLRLLAAMAAGVMLRVDAVGLDLPVVPAGLFLTLLAGAGAGRRSPARGRAATGSRTTRRLQAELVAGQIALPSFW